MNNLRRSFRRARVARRVEALDREVEEEEGSHGYRAGLAEFRVRGRRRESMRARKAGRAEEDGTAQLEERIAVEERLCLGSARMVQAAPAETPLLEASKADNTHHVMSVRQT